VTTPQKSKAEEALPRTKRKAQDERLGNENSIFFCAALSAKTALHRVPVFYANLF